MNNSKVLFTLLSIVLLSGMFVSAEQAFAVVSFTASTETTNTILITFPSDVAATAIDTSSLWTISDSLTVASVTDLPLQSEETTSTTSTLTITTNEDIPTGLLPTVTWDSGSSGSIVIFDDNNNNGDQTGILPATTADAVNASDDNIAPTWSAVHDTLTQTTVTFSEDMTGTVEFEDWTFGGNLATGESVLGDDGDLGGTTSVLIFTHPDLATTATTNAVFLDAVTADVVDQGGTALTVLATAVTDGIDPVITTNLPLTSTSVNDADVVDYDLSEDATSGTIVFTQTGGSADAQSPHTYNLSGPELTDPNTAITLTTLNGDPTFNSAGGLVDGAIYTIDYDATDLAGNTATTVTTLSVTYDVTAPIFSGTAPAASSFNNDADTVDYTLDEDLVSGTITFTQTGGTADVNSPHAFTLSGSELDTGAQSITFADINTGLTNDLVDGSIYTIEYDGDDAAGNSATTVTTTLVTYDVTDPIFSSVAPATLTTNNDADTVDYTLDEDLVSGTITFTQTGGTADVNSPHLFTLTGTQLDSGPQSITFADINIGLASNLVDGAIYTIDYDATDLAGNTATTVTTLSVTYDVTAPIFSGTAPATLTFNNDLDTVDYTLDEAIVSGTITFTRTGGSGDVNSPHAFTLSGAQLNAAPTSITFADINIGLTNDLVTDAEYTIEYDGEDAAGNTATTVTTLTVTYDVTLPVITANSPTDPSNVGASHSVDFDLSEAVASGTITYVPIGGTPDIGSDHDYDFTAPDLASGNHVISLTTLLGDAGFDALVEGTIYRIDIDATDLAGNVAVTDSLDNITYDITAPTFTAVHTSTTTTVVTFSEPIEGTWEIVDWVVTASVVNSMIDNNGAIEGEAAVLATSLTLTHNAIPSDSTLVVNYVSGDLSDEDNANQMADATNDEAEDKIVPTLVSAETGLATNQVRYTFSENVASGTVLAGDFADVNTFEPTSVSVSGAVVTVTFDGTFAVDFTSASAERFTTLAAIDDEAVSPNSLIQGTEITSVAITDGLAPSLVSAVTGPLNTQVTYTFDEAMSDAGGNVAADFESVDGLTPDSVVISGSEITVTFAGGTFDTDFTAVSANQIDETVVDVALNTLTNGDSGAAVAIGDGLSPTYTATTTTLTTTTLTFSEGIDAGTFADADWKVEGINLGVSIIPSGAATGDTTAVLTHDALTNGGTIPTILYTPGTLADQDANALTGSPEFVADGIIPVITTNLPTDPTTLNDDETVDFSISEDLSSGTITFTHSSGPADGNSPQIYTLTGDELTDSNTAITIAALQVGFGNTLVDGAIYTITIDGSDTWGMPNAALTSTTENITYDTSAIGITGVAPASASFNNDADTVEYTLDEAAVLGTITFTGTSGSDSGNAHIFTLTGTQLNAAPTSITFAAINAGLGVDLVTDNVYTMDIDVTDSAGNDSNDETLNITYDTTLPTLTPVGPVQDSENNDSDEVTFDVSEDLTSGSITFTHSSGPADVNSPHTYTLSVGELTAGAETVTFADLQTGFGDSLVDGAFYTITYDATDLAGNDATIVTTLNVKYDITAPTISDVTIISNSVTNTEWAKDGDTITVTITGDELLTVTAQTINGLAATIVDDGTLSPDIQRIVDGTDTETSATFSIIVTDSAGNAASTLTVLDITDGSAVIVDKTLPVVTGATAGITVGGLTELTLTDEYTESCTATDVPHASPSCDVQLGGGSIDTTVLGLQSVIYEAIDEAGNVGTQTIDTTVQDTAAPSIGPVTIESDGLVATLAKDGDTITVTITGDEVLTIIGSPTINGETADIDTNGALTVTATRTVDDGVDTDGVVPFSITVQDPGLNSVPVTAITTGSDVTVDITGPTFNLVTSGESEGGSFITDIVKDVDTYTPDTFTGQADANGVLSSVVSGDTVDESVVAQTIVTYTVTDNAGNTSIVTETVNVVLGDIPIITLTGDAAINVEVQSTYVEQGATATDTEDDLAAIPLTVVIGGDTVDTSAAAGTIFTVTYDVTDSSGNAAVQVTRTVTVQDTTIPIITITGNNPETVSLNTIYTDAGATADDVDDGDITGLIVTVNNVVTSVLGPYTVTYDVIDSSGNLAIQAVRDVTVTLGDAPVITLTGSSEVNVSFRASYTDAGATCDDTEDGDLTGSIIQTGTINTLLPGDQFITFTCTDISGNETQETRTVTVATKRSGNSDEHKTKPTFGVDHKSFKQVVDGGFALNGQTFQVTDNFWTPFAVQTVNIGDTNTFSSKVFAQKQLHVQEFLFGIPEAGRAQDAELGIEVFYDYNGEINDVRIIQDTDIVDINTVTVSHEKSKCQTSDKKEKCDTTHVSLTFLEPLQDDVMAVKAIDYKNRYQITYLNDGFDISGDSLNPMNTMMIPSTEKYEGLVEITQNAKYSNIWTTDDGRIFELNDYDSFKQTNKTYERHVDSGEAKTRSHSEFEAYKQAQIENAVQELLSLCPTCLELNEDMGESFAYEFPERYSSKYDDPEIAKALLSEQQRAQELMDKIYQFQS